MRIVLVVKPYDIEVYSMKDGLHTFVCLEPISKIEGEATVEYERRMTFVLKELCTEMREHDFFKKNSRDIEGIDVILCAPWCTYEAMHIEKVFDRPTRITDQLIQSLHVTKQVPGVTVVESTISQILLNGYTVTKIDGQIAQTVDVQYLAVYGTTTLVENIRKTIETIFHIHSVQISSIYSFVQKEALQTVLPTTNELRVILEEESIDISYLSRGQKILNFFIPYSYKHIEDELQEILGTDGKTIAEVLISRTSTLHNMDTRANKNSKNLWPDLDGETKKKIESQLNKSIEIMLGHIRNVIDTIEKEFLKETTAICVYGLNRKIISAYGYELATKTLEDGYIGARVQLSTNTVFVKKIF